MWVVYPLVAVGMNEAVPSSYLSRAVLSDEEVSAFKVSAEKRSLYDHEAGAVITAYVQPSSGHVLMDSIHYVNPLIIRSKR